MWAIGVSGDGASVFAGGSFQNVGGQAAYGLAKINGGSGALDTTWRPSVRNAGADAGISSLRVQGNFVYGTSWHFGPGGNLEGTFKVPVGNSDVEWLTDCHGDTYSSFMANGIVYVAGHAHYCGNMGGGFPQYSQWKFQHAQAWTDTVNPAGSEILNDVHGYPNWHGVEPGPSLVNWLPDMAMGSYTGQYQAGWNVAGNDNYVVFGGEFPSVNGVGQQGLVRFAVRPIAPADEGPRFVGGVDRAAARARLGHCRPGQLAGRLRPRQPRPHLPGHAERDARPHDDRRLELVDPAHAGLRRHRAAQRERTATSSSSATPTATRSSGTVRRSRSRRPRRGPTRTRRRCATAAPASTGR